MTIKKGEGWGRPAGSHPGLPVAGNDAELASLAQEARQRGREATATVVSGDLLRTLGVDQPRPEGERFEYPVDLGLAILGSAGEDGRRVEIPFVAHVTVRATGLAANPVLCSMLGHGPPIEVAIMNAAWFGDLRLGPRAHPNDGLLDVVEGRVPFRERREALARSRSGSHLPHPDLKTARTAAWDTRFERPATIVIDGVERGSTDSLRVELMADALTVVA